MAENTSEDSVDGCTTSGRRGGSTDECESGRSGPVFRPPLCMQRYELVEQTIAAHPHLHSVVDFGCAGCRLVVRLRIGLGRQLDWIVGVDVDASELRAQAHLVAPLAMECSGACRQHSSLYTALFQGSVADYDERIAQADIATLVELIEHLDETTLDGLVRNIFGRLQPRLVIVTTPNAEFNVLFPGLKGMRHYDHKFEWTRQQFCDWCSHVCEKYPYLVTITGVGTASDASVGYCSQAAIFSKITALTETISMNSNIARQPLPAATANTAVGGLSADQQSPAGSPDCGRCLVAPEQLVGHAQLRRRSDPGCCEPCETLDPVSKPMNSSSSSLITAAPAYATFRPYCLIAEHYVPARGGLAVTSPSEELANELLYQLHCISRSREQQLRQGDDESYALPCHYCASEPPLSDCEHSRDSGGCKRASSPDSEGSCEACQESVFTAEPRQSVSFVTGSWDDSSYLDDPESDYPLCALAAAASEPRLLNEDWLAVDVEERHGDGAFSENDGFQSQPAPRLADANGSFGRLLLPTVTADDCADSRPCAVTAAAIDESNAKCSHQDNPEPTARLVLPRADGSSRANSALTAGERLDVCLNVRDHHSQASARLPRSGCRVPDDHLSLDPQASGSASHFHLSSGSAPSNGTHGAAAPQAVPIVVQSIEGDDEPPLAPGAGVSWPPLYSQVAVDPSVIEGVEECAECPVHIAVYDLLRCPRIHELAEGSAGNVATAAERKGYRLTAGRKVVVFMP